MSDFQENTAEHDPVILKYSPTPFSDASWVAIQKKESSSDFAPLLVETCGGGEQFADPFFADFTKLKQAEEKRAEGPSPEASALNLELEPLGMSHEESRHEESLSEGLSEESARSQEEEKAAEEALRLQAAEYERRIEEAYVRGVEEGRTSATAEAEAAIQALSESVATMLDDLKVQVAEHARATEEKGAELALVVARKLLGTIAAANKEYILPVIKEALSLAGSAEIRRIRVSPQDYEFLKRVTPQGVPGSDDAAWTFQADESVRMGCVVVTSAGEIDFDLDTAWERIRGQLIGAGGVRNG